MDITYFIRNNNNSYNEVCDVASIKVVKNNQIYYGGVQWGHHEPIDAIEFIKTNCDQIRFHEWLNSVGYEIVLENPPM